MPNYIDNFFTLNNDCKKHILSLTPKFGFDVLGEVTFLRTYSRVKDDGTNETWNEVVIRCTEGLFSIYIDFLIKKGIDYDIHKIQVFASEYAEYMFHMRFLPAGRALYSLGTRQVTERGSACMYNCAAISTKGEDLADCMYWTCDMLFNGSGVGFTCDWNGEVTEYNGTFNYTVPDSKEGWSESIKLIIEAYTKNKPLPIFDYSSIRAEGTPLKTFGGIAPGPKPLIQTHKRLLSYFELYLDVNVRGRDKLESFLDFTTKDYYRSLDYIQNNIKANIDKKTYSKCRLVCDIGNACGVMISSGGIRRSAMMAAAPIAMKDFIYFKNMEINPERMNVCWMSNNSVIIEEGDEIDDILSNILLNGEPGIINMTNCRKYGRYGEESEDLTVICTNPCGEQALSQRDLCNLAEVYPIMCEYNDEYIRKAAEFATFGCIVISLLPTHIKVTNEIVNKNRRIGVSLGGAAQVYEKLGDKFEQFCDGLYRHVRYYANEMADTLGVSRPIRVTTIEPSGTKSLVVGTTCGLHYPKFTTSSRRIGIAKVSPICEELIAKRIPYEQSCTLDNTWNFIFPIKYKMDRASDDISFEESASILEKTCRSYTDSCASVTLYFSKEKESDKILDITKNIISKVKSLSIYPHTPQGVYRQTPYCKANKIQYKLHKSLINNSSITKSDSEPEKFCQGISCGVRLSKAPQSKNTESDTLLSLIRNEYDVNKDYTEVNRLVGNKNKSLWPYPFLGLSHTDEYVYFAMLPINESDITSEMIKSSSKYRLNADGTLISL